MLGTITALLQNMNEKFEGKGWENSISVDSLDELIQSGLDAALSSGDDDYGFIFTRM